MQACGGGIQDLRQSGGVGVEKGYRLGAKN